MKATTDLLITELGTYQARNGEVWRVICLNGNNADYPVVALDSKGNPNTFTAGGQLRLGQDSEFDLVDMWVGKPVRVERWQNVYIDGDDDTWNSKEVADSERGHGRTGVLRIVHEDGKLVSCEVEPIDTVKAGL